MAFDPDEYLAKKGQAAKAFDPDAYLASKMAPTGPQVSKLESALRGGAEGATLGFAPAISGTIDSSPAIMNALTGTGSLSDIADAYRQGRDSSKAAFKASEEANPKSYFAGSLAGGVVPALLTGGATEGASALKAGATLGAKFGGLSGLGNSISNGDSLVDTGKNVLGGTLGGAALGGLVGKVGGALEGLPESLENMANERALKATGIGKAQLKNILKGDIKANAFKATTGDEAQDTVKKLGSNLLEKNPYQDSAIVTPGSTSEDILEKSQDLAQKSDEDIAGVLTKLDENYSRNNPTFFNPDDAASEIKEQLLTPLTVNGKIPPMSQGPANTLQNIIDTIKQYGEKPIPFQTAQELKQLITNNVNYSSDASNNQLLKQAGGIVNKQIEAAADNTAQESGDSALLDRYLKAKQLYGTAKTAIDASTGKVAGNMVNRDFGLTDYQSAGAGAVIHGTPGLIVGAIGNKLSKTYGNSLLATGAKGASNVLSNVSNTLVKAPKEAIGNLGKKLISSGGDLATKLGNVLVNASNRDDVGRSALIFSLMQNPGYRELLNSHLGTKSESK